MNVDTREISFTDLTAQEIAELQAITDDYYRRYDSPHPPGSPHLDDQTMDADKTTPQWTRIAG